MSDFRLLSGEATNQLDPKRRIWYSTGCGYWTDDWSKLCIEAHTPPACPHCGCFGFSTPMDLWSQVPPEFLKCYPRYDEWLLKSKEKCNKALGANFMDHYFDWMKNESE